MCERDNYGNFYLQEQEGRLRHLRLEEVQRKMELEMAKNAEERLLREARRRQVHSYHISHNFLV